MSKSITLTPEIMAIMTKAGISEAEIKRLEIKPIKAVVKITKQKPAQEYILKSIRKCKLCGFDSISIFHMTRMEDNPSILESCNVVESTPSNLPVETRHKIWSTCNHCREYLQSLSQEELITMTLKIYSGREIWK